MEPLPDDALDRVFRTGRTYNHYLDRPVPTDTLRALWDLLKFGPTSANQQPLRIVWCVSDEAKAKLADCTSGTNGEKILKAPVTAILGMDLEFYEKLPRTFPHADARSWFLNRHGTPNAPLVGESAQRNATLQGAYFIVAARMLGLGTGPMSGIDRAKIDAAFFAGTPIRTDFVATLGYGDDATVHARLPRLDFDEATRIG